MKNIFLSYTTRDSYINYSSLSIILPLLSSVGNVYIDLLHNDSFNKQERVEKELANADLMFLLRSDRIESSPWVRLEINRAKELCMPIVSVKVGKDQDLKSQVVSKIAFVQDLLCK